RKRAAEFPRKRGNKFRKRNFKATLFAQARIVGDRASAITKGWLRRRVHRVRACVGLGILYRYLTMGLDRSSGSKGVGLMQ
ncbi:hypothetical protein, partial [Streptomyces sp. NPDC002790]|uniref:hypothetical protein n=1 Tax=Streptomyces sp. NPDC002790 TaxID=3154431 RepID=UPI003324E84A